MCIRNLNHYGCHHYGYGYCHEQCDSPATCEPKFHSILQCEQICLTCFRIKRLDEDEITECFTQIFSLLEPSEQFAIWFESPFARTVIIAMDEIENQERRDRVLGLCRHLHDLMIFRQKQVYRMDRFSRMEGTDLQRAQDNILVVKHQAEAMMAVLKDMSE